MKRVPLLTILTGILLLGLNSAGASSGPSTGSGSGGDAEPSTLQCTSYASKILGRDVRYCVDRSTPDVPRQPGEPVAYFMHGTNGSARTWTHNNYEGSLATLRHARALTPMTFVSFDTSPYSFFSDHPVHKGSKDTSKAYETWFIEEFIPYIEKTLDVCAERACRGIMGQSMGGFGALKTAFKHPELFAAVAVNSPALSPFETRAPFLDWILYFSTKHIGPFKGLLVTTIFFRIFDNDRVFDENNPTYLARNTTIDPLPAIYFDMGGKDSYGFYDGYHLLKAAFDERKIPYSTLFEPQGHHDMWKRHASDSILFEMEHLAH